MTNFRSKQALYESIMQDVSKIVKRHLNEMKPETYDSAADKRQAQLDRLSPVMKRQLKQDQLDAPARLRQHADKMRNGYYPDITKLSDKNKFELEIKKAIKNKDYQTLKDIYDLYLKKQKTSVIRLGALDAKTFQRYIKLFTKVFGNNCNLNWLDVSEITDMRFVFYESQFNGDISKWDVSNVKNMGDMFCGSDFNGDISQWNVSNVEDMSYMFEDSMFNGDISGWDVSNVTDMACMFSHSKFNEDISGWDVSNVTNMACMFQNSRFDGDISEWNVKKVKYMTKMFQTSKFNGDISRWDVSNVTDMAFMFGGSQFNGDISAWDVSNVTDMFYMFAFSKFNRDISKWDVSAVENNRYIFDNCPIKKEYKPRFKN